MDGEYVTWHDPCEKRHTPWGHSSTTKLCCPSVVQTPPVRHKTEQLLAVYYHNAASIYTFNNNNKDTEQTRPCICSTATGKDANMPTSNFANYSILTMNSVDFHIIGTPHSWSFIKFNAPIHVHYSSKVWGKIFVMFLKQDSYSQQG